MKKIFASKTAFWMGLAGLVFTSLVAVFVTVLVCLDRTQNGSLGSEIFSLLFIYAFDAMVLIVLNRSGSRVLLEDGVIKRKGLFFGFYKECKVQSILKVKVTRVYRQGDFIFLIDGNGQDYSWLCSCSYICFRKTKQNMKFLRQFWQGRIES